VWIIPKTLSAFVPDTEGLNLALSEQAWMLEQSAMWRSKHSSKQTWLRRLKKGGWITHLSGRILKPSLHESFVEKFVDSLVDIPVSHFRQQASDKEKKTQDTYGHTSSSTSGQLDLFGVFGKMSQDTPRWGYGESCPIWKKKVTDARSAYSVRKKLALHTKGNECSSLRNYPTPEAHTVEKYSLQKDGQKKTQRSRNLTAMAINGELAKGMRKGETEIGAAIHADCLSSEDVDAIMEKCNAKNVENGHTHFTTNYQKMDASIVDQKNWATPQASDHIEGARTAKESNQKCLGRDLNQMQNWPTPRAGNPGSRKPGTGGKILAEEAKIHNGLQDQEKSNTSGKNHGSPKLSANWVEQLMGLSTGWTDLGSWGMELSPKPQN